jgi:hypothetical protein
VRYLFWFSLLAVFYAYLGYPLFLWLVSLFSSRSAALSWSRILARPMARLMTMAVARVA